MAGKQADSVEVTERLFLNADKSKVVKEDSPDAAFLFATPGKRVPRAEAERLGMLTPEPAPEPEAKAVESAPANKARTMPPEAKGK